MKKKWALVKNWYNEVITGIPVVAQSWNAFVFLSPFFFLRHKMEKLRNSTQY